MLNQNHSCVVGSANFKSVKYVVSHEVEPLQEILKWLIRVMNKVVVT